MDASDILTEYTIVSSNLQGNFNELQKFLADVDKDGRITSMDASAVLSYYTNKGSIGDLTLEEFLFGKEYLLKVTHTEH